MEEASSSNPQIDGSMEEAYYRSDSQSEDIEDEIKEAYYSSDSQSEDIEADLEGKINQLLEALSTTQMITENQENTDMERASISHHVKDLVGKINELLVPLSTAQMITNHFNLNQENNDMERASISHHVKDLEGKINQVLVLLSTTHMITKHYKLNRVNNDMERASISHPVEDLEGKIKQLIEHLSKTQEIIKKYKLRLENAAAGIEDVLSKILEERMQNSNVNIGHYRPLIRAIKENDVKAQKDFLNKNPDTPMKSVIDEFDNTVFHLIVQQSFNSETVKLLKVLVSKVLVDSPTTLKNVNVYYMTALDIAASAGNTQAVKLFVEKYKRLLSNRNEAVCHAALWGRKETVRYLLSVTYWTEEFALDHGASLLKLLIKSNLHGIALGILKHYPRLADWKGNKFWNDTVYALATKYRAFASGRKLGFWENLIYQYIPVKDNQDHIAWPSGDSEDGDLEKQNHKSSTNSSEKFPILPQIAATFEGLGPKLWDALIQLVPSIKRIHDQKLMHTQTLEIVRLMISKADWNYKEASERLKKPVLTAARLGIHEFVDEVLKAYQYSVLFRDKERNNIILLAVSYRKEKVFSLIRDQMASIKVLPTYFSDRKGSNILHLAAKFVPSSQVPGSALQMQRELQWFKRVRECLPPYLQEELNKSGETPEEVFSIEHKDLVEKGEKWMRDTATSCSVVAALIITIVFAAAITVPGGNNANGIPNFLNETYFRIFAFSTAIALFSSTTSVQMFLGMLTSRYAEEDFLELLPGKLIIGLMALFLSSSSMMVSFGAAFCIVLYHPWKWIIVLICLLGCFPITLFASMQFPLLVDIFISTYGRSVFRSMKPKTS